MSNITQSSPDIILPASAENAENEVVQKEIAVNTGDGKPEEQEYAWNPGDTTPEDLLLADPDSEDDAASEAALRRCGSDIDSEDFIHAADRAEHLEDLPLSKQVCVLSHLPAEEAAEALAELDEEMAGDVLESMDADDAARLIAEMDPDDAVDILEEVDEDHRDILLSNLPQEDAEQLRNLLSFDPDTAAGVMNTEIIMVPLEVTVDDAIQIIRSELEEKEMPYYVYVTDQYEVLEGVISLRDLMLARPGTPIQDMVNRQDVIAVQYDADKEEV
ncbi:MAG: magnesium transporter, partial [Mailhella sp.]|nr:magnesium transporter [Mailhella sp.]